MNYRLLFTVAAKNDIAGFDKPVRKRVFAKLEYYMGLVDSMAQVKKLIGTNNRYRFRVGEYRVIFLKQKDGRLVVLLVLKIAHQRGVYE
jgi:mRNA-degrading endonuclease RelE of RelBE toxin-antitoxin system